MPRDGQGLVERVLKDHTLFPNEFKKWLLQFIQNNPNLQVPVSALPKVEARRYVGDAGQPAFEHSWVAVGGSTFEQPGFYKDSQGVVHLFGVTKNGTVTAVIFTLPVGYRPKASEVVPVSSNGAFGSATIAADGSVTASVGSNTSFSLSGISFRAFF